MVLDFKASERGPYKDIRWFCKDGTINMPKEPCGDIGGVQRARYRDDVEQLSKTNHIFMGQILSTTSNIDFWDAEHGHSRLKQYQLEKFLRAADNGWILQKAQYYRGAIQVEDEEDWGIQFLASNLERNSEVEQNFYLLRQAVKDIPHTGNTDRTQNIRALSKTISDRYPPFMQLRIKIHGQPDVSDIAACISFKEKHKDKLSAADLKNFETMLAEMKIVYQPLEPSNLTKYTAKIGASTSLRKEIDRFINSYQDFDQSDERTRQISAVLFSIRKGILSLDKGKERLALMDLSLALEEILFKEAGSWTPESKTALMQKIHFLSLAAVGCGYLEMWEWEKIKPRISVSKQNPIDLQKSINWHEDARRIVEWSAGMTRGVYRPIVEIYSSFEPLAYGFFDDKIRSSLLLPLGNAVSELGTQVAEEANFSNQVLDLPNQSSFRGLNPGYALGKLVVVNGPPDEVEVSKDNIYIFHHPPSDLKPVAGIATVTEGNLVSHVQLLARNLGIPNAVLSEESLQNILAYDGQRMFYAVSNKGTILMKSEKDMTDEERKLFETKKRTEERIRVPVDQLELKNTGILALQDVDATDSGKKCGPKAANLGQLKAMFPKNVVEGIVIPFSIFRQHMDQVMPDQSGTYWEFLNSTFAKAANKEAAEAEKFILEELATFREAIRQIPFRDDFVKDLETMFKQTLGNDIGKVPVFLRSDTNMEDLKEFTGAGLNLTLFNVLSEKEILQGIRDVWASPYTERSYKWRQKYLLNPENVYPSILIIPGVNVDYSGVLITKGITSGSTEDQTVAFSRGVGGAVDGQAAESYLLTNDGENILLSPAREPIFRFLPASGGTAQHYASFEAPILNQNNLETLRKLTRDVNRILPNTPGIESTGPFDIELGFQDDKMWLFQIRPFVENKNATASAYLASITPDIKTLKTENQEKGKTNQTPKEDSGQIPAGKSIPVWIYGLGVLVLAFLLYLTRRKQIQE